MDFREFAKKEYIKPRHRILEFGPLIRPAVTRKTHPHVYYADIRSTEDIKKLYTSNDYLESTGLTVDTNQVVNIDYVVNDSYKNTFKNVEKFDVVVLSHVIEHMPDIIGFFQDIKHVLKRSGQLIIIYPDARYCFDHFRNGTSFIDAYDVYRNKDTSSKRVFDFVYDVVHENRANYFWKDPSQNSIMPTNSFEAAEKAAEKAKRGELPDDTHFWPFSNYQLIKFLYDMDRAGLLEFDIVEFYPTPENHQECMLVLEMKKRPGIKHDIYRKIFDEISPAIASIVDARRIAELEDKLTALKQEHRLAKDELDAIKGSKKWKYAQKAGEAKNRLLGRKHE